MYYNIFIKENIQIKYNIYICDCMEKSSFDFDNVFCVTSDKHFIFILQYCINATAIFFFFGSCF